MASLWKLPVIFLCQNNQFAECTRYADGTTVAHVADRAASYSMRGVTVDGNDPEAMWQASREAVERARAGEGPTLLEAVTFRFMGHYFGDPGAYIPKDEYAAALARDPMPATKAAVLQTKAASEADLETMARDINAQIDDAVKFAADSSPPEPDEINRDIYAPGAPA
jgi:pyruvate dehydrogenase E1 component alpha subunit